MNVDPNILNLVGKILAVNAAVLLLLAVMSYLVSALMLEGLAALDRWLDPSRLRAGTKDARWKLP